jgi:limonene-1,2-epoxide hydrolase
MTTPTETVAAFLAMWKKNRGFGEAVQAYFTPATIWENVGMTKTTGPQEALTAFPGFGDGGPPIRVDVLAIAAAGNMVLTERIDHIFGPDGKPALSIPVMGAFEVKDGKITAWRDYFDTAGFAGAAQG